MRADWTVIGGGLAGCEAAWQIARRGLTVLLIEMRPVVSTGAHTTGGLAELVCSNSLGSDLPDRASGALKRELDRLGSMVLGCARESAVPAGGALAVDRGGFSRRVSDRIASEPRIRLERREAVELPFGPAVVASGPLTSDALAQSIRRFTGEHHLYFFDAIAPIVLGDSVDRDKVFTDARNDAGDDYLNCPLTEEEYKRFLAALRAADCLPLRDFEQAIRTGVQAGHPDFFEGCVPVEELARRGDSTLAYGVMRLIGLRDPRTGRRPFAVVQLRREDREGRQWNLVGFQTNLRESDQQRIFRMIPGLERAEFTRYGRMHRNTFLNAPRLLRPTLQARTRDDLFFAGQLSGVEGYVGNIASGWLAGFNAARLTFGLPAVTPPPETLLGALCAHLSGAEEKHFQPVKANYGILPPLAKPPRERIDRNAAYSARAGRVLDAWIASLEPDWRPDAAP